MTWTYSGLPGTSLLDETRFYIQDTDQAFPLLTDEELDFLLDTYMPIYGSTLAVGAMACEVLAARFARDVDTSADGVSVSLGSLQQRYNDLATSLRDQYKEIGSGELAHTLDQMFSDVSVYEIEPLVFGVGFMDNYRVGQQDFGYYAPGETNWVENSTSTGSAAYASPLKSRQP
jgi:hypothetical protein